MVTKLPPDFYLPLFEQAAAEEIGIEIKVEPEDQTLLVNALYEARKDHPEFKNLMLFQPQPAGTIFIAHKTVELPE